MTRRHLQLVALVVVAGVAAVALGPRRLLSAASTLYTSGLSVTWRHYTGAPTVRWDQSSPQEEELDPEKLSELAANLMARETRAFLVARHGRLVYERYGEELHANTRHSTAALAKATTASTTLALAVEMEAVQLDDPVSAYYPAWADHPTKSAITIRHLATHSSGVDDVYFGDAALDGWKERYLDNPPTRFRMALDSAPIIFQPGDRYSYSGVGFHVLAYALARGLDDIGHDDMLDLLQRRIFTPCGIPPLSWRASYGDRYQVDELTLYSLGSGGSFSARAVAKVGQLFLDEGRCGDRQVLQSRIPRAFLSYGRSPNELPVSGTDPPAGISWWTNANGFWPSLPRDAAVGAGANHNVVLVVPSLELVAVRLGGSLTGTHWDGPFWDELEEFIFRPLIAAMR